MPDDFYWPPDFFPDDFFPDDYFPGVGDEGVDVITFTLSVGPKITFALSEGPTITFEMAGT